MSMPRAQVMRSDEGVKFKNSLCEPSPLSKGPDGQCRRDGEGKRSFDGAEPTLWPFISIRVRDLVVGAVIALSGKLESNVPTQLRQ